MVEYDDKDNMSFYGRFNRNGLEGYIQDIYVLFKIPMKNDVCFLLQAGYSYTYNFNYESKFDRWETISNFQQVPTFPEVPEYQKLILNFGIQFHFSGY